MIINLDPLNYISLDAQPDQLRADGRTRLYRETARGKLAEAGGR
jgi:hypothetical protein